MIFVPKTEEELQRDGLLPEGIYAYQVIKSEDKPNKAKTNIYTSITLKVWDNEGKERLVFTNMALTKLLKHFCDVNDMKESYQSGQIHQESFMHKSGGRVVIGIDPEKPNPEGGTYKAKNIVKDYIYEPRASGMKPLPDIKDSFADDPMDIPFEASINSKFTKGITVTIGSKERAARPAAETTASMQISKAVLLPIINERIINVTKSQ